jgi:hypothetical protein
MTRFFFDVILDGVIVRDETGMELPDLEAAREECLTAAREATVKRLLEGGGVRNGAFLITEGAGGDPLLIVPFEASLVAPQGGHMP